MLSSRTTFCFGLLVTAFVLSACPDAESTRGTASTREIAWKLEETAGQSIITLEKSPTALLAELKGAVVAAPIGHRIDLSRVSPESHIADVAGLQDGRVAILFRDQHRVVVLDSMGQEQHRFGRMGQGPGEFSDPVAIASTGSGYVVLDMADGRPMSRFSVDGHFLHAPRLPTLADWPLAYSREPILDIDSPFQMGPEDVTRRIARTPGGFSVLVSDRSGIRWSEGDTVPKQRLVKQFVYSEGPDPDRTGIVSGVEQVTSRTPLTDQGGTPLREARKRTVEPLYTERPLIAGTDSWNAIYRPDSSTIVIQMQGASSLVVRWPDSPRVPVTDSIRIAAAELKHTESRKYRSGVRELWQRSSAEDRRRILRTSASLLAFADSLSAVSALFAGDRCLWIAGTVADDFVDGTALTLIGIDIEAKAVGRPVRIGMPGTRLRDVTDEWAFATTRDENGEFTLERFPLPNRCATDGAGRP